MWKKSDETDVTETVNMGTNTGGARKSTSTVGGQSMVVGEIKGQEDLVVMGTVDGTITLAQNTVTIGKTGMIKGTINSQTILVEGKVEGDLKATDKIVLRASANVKGNIAAGRLVMEDGCYFQGGIDMIESKSAAPKPVAPAVKPANTGSKPTQKVGG